MSKILISVVIPAYNYAKTLSRAAESVLNQLDEHCELLIIDDGSTDDTPAVIALLEQSYPQRFRAVRQKNAGLSAVRNRGIDMARGDYLVFLDADDELTDHALGNLIEHITQNPQTRLVIGGHVSVHPDGRIVEYLPDTLPSTGFERLLAYLLEKKLRVCNGACAMHREVFAVGRYPEQFRNAEDIPVFAQVLAGYPCTLVGVMLARIHKHSDSLRHNLSYDREVGDRLVAEVFDSGRLPVHMQGLRRQFAAQRYLSLFRTCAAAGESQVAKTYYRQAIKTDWRAILRGSYTRKAIKLWLEFKK